ncbi:MAG: AMP-binding protein [Bdellovibrionaceae bacterium]|nr:AMP-binding protein [Pseudobdellovibrionaceae bacterium]
MNLRLFSSLSQAKSTLSQWQEWLFNSSTSFLFLNEQLAEHKKNEILSSIQKFLEVTPITTDPFFLVPTSGTTSVNLKIVLITKKKFLQAAQRANTFLQATMADSWLISLPLHHVAGLSILARAHLGKNDIHYWPKWNPKEFLEKLSHGNITFCSLVPTQIFDVLAENISAPKHLKRVLVGGSALSDAHYQQMLTRGWPLLKTYGMTETSAFMSFSTGDEFYQPLPGVAIRLDVNQRLAIHNDCLFEGYLVQSNETWQYQEKKLHEGYWSTEDRAEFKTATPSQFRLLGREQGMIKIKGELVNVHLLNVRLIDIAAGLGLSAPIIHYVANQRNENELFVLLSKNQDPNDYVSTFKRFNQDVLPYERIGWYIQIDDVPRTELGKIKISVLNSDSFKEAYRENRKIILD